MDDPQVLSEADRRKLDDGPDEDFYGAPRFVTHADDGVLVVSFTDRLFPTKAVRAWRTASMAGREDLVRSYVAATGAFDTTRVVRDRPERDPFRAVVATR